MIFVPESVESPAPVAEPDVSAEPNVPAEPESAVPEPTEPEPAEPEPAEPEDDYDHLFGATIHRPLAAAAVRRPDPEDEPSPSTPSTPPTPAAAAPAPAGDHDGHTIMSGDIAAMRARHGAQAAPSSAPVAAVPQRRLFIESSDGVRESLDQPLLLGRAPSATRVPGSAVPRLVTVVTPNQELSRTHVELRVEGGTVVVTDLHSKNGTLVTLPGRAPQRVREGEPTPVIVGSVIDLGDGAVYTVGES